MSVLEDSLVKDVGFKELERFGPGSGLTEVLRLWARADPRPLVLLIDEFDALVGDSLIAILRQLRTGYPNRPREFPQCVVLCGARNLRDYRIQSGTTGETVTGGGVFNISAGSLRLGDFSEAEVDSLLRQHTAETGQEFHPQAIHRVWAQTCGRPWLVNALCDRTCSRNRQERERPVTEEDFLEAQEQLIPKRTVHLDQLR